jgi:hypothetical protein
MLVTLAQAKGHLRLTWAAGDPRDADLQLKLDSAEAIILDACNATVYWRDVTATWTDPATVPKRVHQVILLELADLWEDRGDQRGDDGPTPGIDLSQRICALLYLYRDPVLG